MYWRRQCEENLTLWRSLRKEGAGTFRKKNDSPSISSKYLSLSHSETHSLPFDSLAWFRKILLALRTRLMAVACSLVEVYISCFGNIIAYLLVTFSSARVLRFLRKTDTETQTSLSLSLAVFQHLSYLSFRLNREVSIKYKWLFGRVGKLLPAFRLP